MKNIEMLSVRLLTAFCCSLLLLNGCQDSTSKETLNSERVSMERENYPTLPLFPTDDSNAHYSPVPYENWLGIIDNFVHVKVLSKQDTTFVDSTEFAGIKDRLLSFRAEVIADSAGELQKGEEIVISSKELDENLIPTVEVQDEFIFPLITSDSEANEKHYWQESQGSFYVNNDGHVLSVYEDLFTEFSGMQASALLEKLGEDSNK